MNKVEETEVEAIVDVLMEAEKTADGVTVFTRWHHAAEALYKAGYRKVKEYEYAIQYHDELAKAWKITDQYHGGDGPEYWGELKEREVVLEDLRLDYPLETFLMVKRAKAGPVWYA